MLESSIAAAKAAGARLVFPGTVYSLRLRGVPEGRRVGAGQPRTRKGALRVAMEQRLEEASPHGLPVPIVRAADFFGRHAGNGRARTRGHGEAG